MNISKTDFRTPFGKLLRLPLKLIPNKTVLPIIQGTLKGKKWIKGSSINGCWLGTYELDKQVLFSKYVKPGMIVYDVGANVGFYTLLSSLLVNEMGKVYSFEPLPLNISTLKKHIELNKLRNVIVTEKAVSNKVSTVKFNFGDNRSAGFISKDGQIEVDTISIDEFIRQDNPQPDLMKIDIEGAEYEALIGAKELLRRKKPVIFLATHSDKLREKCLKLLAEFGYTISTVDKKPIDETDEFVCE